MSRRLQPVTALLVLLSVSLIGCQNAPASLLFVQVADGGRLLDDDDGDGWHDLVLDGVSPHVIYFSDRPDRITGTTSLDEFMDNWDEGADSFEKVPPNAAVAKVGMDSIEIIEIRRPVVDGSTLTYETRILSTSMAFAKAEAPSDLAPGHLGRVVLFIDNLSYSKRDPMNRTDNFGRRR